MDPRDARLQDCARAADAAGVDLLLLIGSRARGDERPDSDWDFAAALTSSTNILALTASLSAAVGDDRLDVVDLARAGGLVRYHAARDGVLLHQARPGLHLAFQMQATSFWCDNEALIAREYRAILAELAR